MTIGGRSYGSGFLGPKHQPLIVADPARGVENLKPLVGQRQFDNRVGLLEEMEQAFHRDYQADAGDGPQDDLPAGRQLMKSKEAKAFDLSDEPARSRRPTAAASSARAACWPAAWSKTGVPFVEVTLGGWDTHQDNFDRVKNLSGEVDPAMSALITDLKERGLLDSTLVIWMGEFGRTPKINAARRQAGPRPLSARLEHASWPAAASRAARSIGKTDKEGAAVIERPISGARLHGHGLQDPRHQLQQAEQHADRPAHPHRGQGRRADQGTAWLRLSHLAAATRGPPHRPGSRFDHSGRIPGAALPPGKALWGWVAFLTSGNAPPTMKE